MSPWLPPRTRAARLRGSATVPPAASTAPHAAAVLGAVLLAIAVAGCGSPSAASGPRVIVLGFDGMDHELTRRMIDEGRLPNLARLADEGHFRALETAVPPQSPVAWSTFLTGMDAGGHGIYDFVHRNPATMAPYLSTSETTEAGTTLTLGDWQVPLSGGEVRLLRHGEAFWQRLEEAGVRTTIVRIPANFPPSGTASRELSGMGTPDLLGTSGTFSFYTQDMAPWRGEDISSGQVFPVDVIDGVVEATLFGPPNPFRVESEDTYAPFSVHLDPVEPAARVVVGNEDVVLAEGEWSDWVPVQFELVPWVQSLHGIVRFYLKQVRPTFQLYVTPANIDPTAPAMPISTPEGYAAELAAATGLYYTQEMPEDTGALTHDVFDRDEFVRQAALVRDESLRQYEHVLGEFRDGLLFYYFGNADQVSHMLWRTMDPEHPAYDPELDAPYADVIPGIYEDLDRVVGSTLERIEELGGDTLLVVMSDHGFESWRRAFNLNSWLVENGYMTLRDPDRRPRELFVGVDWSQTRAYALGLSGLYVNLRGRERNGIVPPSQRDPLLEQIADDLRATVDPATGEPAVTRVYIREQVYDDTGHLEIGPDILVGYAAGTRGSNDSALGGVSEQVITDNTAAWSGDHIMDHREVPGVLFTSRPLRREATSLKDLAAALLAEFGLEGFPRRASE